MNPEKEIARWSETVDELEKRVEVAHARTAELSNAKKPLTLAAHTGDQKAKTKLAEINAEIIAAEQEAADLV